MFLRKAARTVVKKKTLALTMLILALTGSAALALTLNGDGTLVGTPGNDTIQTGNGNDTVYGLAGSDTINAANGNDTINGDGTCPPGSQGAVYPNGMGTNSCENNQNQDQNGQGDTINAGNGNDTVFGGGGHNAINVGNGTDTIYGGPMGDKINTGVKGTVTIILCGTVETTLPCTGGGNTLNLGIRAPGGGGGTSGIVYAQNGVADTINCYGTNSVTVYADKTDRVNGCQTVKYSYPAGDRVSLKHRTIHERNTAKRKHSAHKARR